MLTPRPYQIEGRDFLAARTHALLADEMRVGKTPQAIMAAEKVGASAVLVVCPAIAVEHWRREWWKWGTRAINLAVMSYDKAKLNAEELRKTKWDVLMIDECHFAKNPEAARTKLIYGKEGLGWSAARMWALSGTPAPKHAGELWPMLRAFGVVKMTYEEFVRHYCTVNPFSGQVTGTKVAMIPELKAILAKVMLRRTRKQVAPEMPDVGFEFLPVEVGVDIDGPYEASDDGLLRWIEGSSSVDREDRYELAMAKVGPLVENIAAAIKDEELAQTVVFGWHVDPLVEAAAKLRARGIMAETLTGAASQRHRQDVQDHFKNGSTQVVLANILAAGTAIDLSSASHGHFLELDWVPGNNMQAANRLVSMMKEEKVTFDLLTVPGSFDERIQRVLLRRAQQINKLLA